MTEDDLYIGAWGLALIAIVAVSWALYRWLAPKSWREWASAGIVQAFVIPLYAEMYGFPLTIYLLTRFFGLDRPDVSANLWSTLFGLGPGAMLIAMLLGYALVVTGIAIIVQGWRELYRARKENRLASDGLYAVVRHPQYTGLFIALFGEGIVHWPTVFSVLLFPLIVLAFAALARREERQVLEQFGDEFRAYQRRVLMFIPRWGQWGELVDRSSAPGARR